MAAKQWLRANSGVAALSVQLYSVALPGVCVTWLRYILTFVVLLLVYVLLTGYVLCWYDGCWLSGILKTTLSIKEVVVDARRYAHIQVSLSCFGTIMYHKLASDIHDIYMTYYICHTHKKHTTRRLKFEYL